MKVIIDANSICHREKYVMGDLSWEDKSVGVIFGFFKQLLKFSKLYQTNKFIFCWDSKTSLRKKIYPEYKDNRNKNKTQEEKEFDKITYLQFDLLKKEILSSIGFKNNFECEGFESDDLIATIVKNNPLSKFVIVSSDNDLYQLLRGNNVVLYELHKKKEYTEEDFIEDFRVSVNYWPLIKAVAGCFSDNVKGFKGVGEKTALKIVKKELKPQSKLNKLLQSDEGKKLVKRNLQLVTLPFSNTLLVNLSGKETLSLKNFIKICDRYGFQSFLRKESLEEWKERFSLK
jgi:DNA polymerase-1